MMVYLFSFSSTRERRKEKMNQKFRKESY